MVFFKRKMAGNQKRGGEYDEFGGKRTRGYNDARFEMRVLVPSRVSFYSSQFSLSMSNIKRNDNCNAGDKNKDKNNDD